MSILKKILRLSALTASSLLRNEVPEKLLNSKLFSQDDKKYIIEHLTDKKVIKLRAEQLSQINIEQDWKKVQQRIGAPASKSFTWKYAAAAAVLIFAGTMYFSQEHRLKKAHPQKSNVAVKSLIQPGTDKAVLVLGSGQQIVLGKGKGYKSGNISSNGKELIYNNNADEKTALSFNYLTIPRGGQFFIKLADGTQVWLNSESKLKFPAAFIDGLPREVELMYGEAYFEVSPSTSHKGSHFNVLTHNQNVEVLGTEFNIKAYPDSKTISTTLVKGKVSLSNNVVSKFLQPGDQSVMDINSNYIHIRAVDVFNEVSWKDGVFSFKEMPLRDIMKVLERWYDIKTVFKREATQQITFNGILDKNQKIEEILNIISNTNKIPYEINQKTVIFK
jgi:transmembrane sensor